VGRASWPAAGALAGLLFFSILTIWIPDRWAVSVFQTGVFALGVGWAVRMVWRPYSLKSSLLLLPLGGAFLWGLVQLATGHTVYRFETWTSLLNWAAAFVVFFVGLQALAAHSVRRAFLRALGYFGLAVSVLAATQFFTSPGKVFWVFPTPYPDGVLGPFLSPNTYAAFIELVLPIAVWESIWDRRRSWLWSGAAGIMFSSVIAGASRAGASLLALEIVILVLLAARRQTPGRALAPGVLRILVVAAVFITVLGWEVIWKRFQQADPYVFRRELLSSSLAMLEERPWMGFGLGTWPVVYPAYALFDIGMFANHAHNDWAEWAAEGGIPFLLILLTVAVWSGWQVVRSPWGLGVVSVFIHCLVDYPMQKPALAALVCAMLGALAASRSRRVEGAASPGTSSHSRA
jgi:O-antigen ligase